MKSILSDELIKRLYRKWDYLQPNGKAKVGILASKKYSRKIDSVVFIKSKTGCSDFPQMESRNIAKAVTQVLKLKLKIRGLVNLFVGDDLTKTNYVGIIHSDCYLDMIRYKGWENKDYVYVEVGNERLVIHKLSDNEKSFIQIETQTKE